MLYLSVINDKISKFFIKNASAIYKFIIIAIVIIAAFTFFNKYKNKKENTFNQKLFDIINNNDSNLMLLKDLYGNNSLTRNNKVFTGLVLAKEYVKAGNIEDAIKIYDSIHEISTDKFIRDFAGYNLFRLSLNMYDAGKILNIYNTLIGENSSMSDFVKEQYSLYLLVNDRVDEAKVILESIQPNKNNKDLFDRIELYRTAYKF